MGVRPAPLADRGRDFVRRWEMVSRVCERLETGESLSSICRDPLMPQRYVLDRWRANEPMFEEMVAEARAKAEREGLWTRRASHEWSEALAAEILDRIAAGRTLVDVCQETDMPHHTSVTRWLGEKPEFQEAYRAARQAQADRLFDLAWRIALEADEGNVRLARLKIDAIKWRVAKLAPRRYGPALAIRNAERQAEEEAEAEAAAQRPVWMKHFELGEDGKVRVAYMYRVVPKRTPDEPLLLLYPGSDTPEPPRDPSHFPGRVFQEPWERELLAARARSEDGEQVGA